MSKKRKSQVVTLDDITDLPERLRRIIAGVESTGTNPLRIDTIKARDGKTKITLSPYPAPCRPASFTIKVNR